MTWRGCAGINPLSGLVTPDEKYLPGRGVAAWAASSDCGVLTYLVRRSIQLPALMNPYGIAWRRQKEEARAERDLWRPGHAAWRRPCCLLGIL